MRREHGTRSAGVCMWRVWALFFCASQLPKERKPAAKERKTQLRGATHSFPKPDVPNLLAFLQQSTSKHAQLSRAGTIGHKGPPPARSSQPGNFLAEAVDTAINPGAGTIKYSDQREVGSHVQARCGSSVSWSDTKSNVSRYCNVFTCTHWTILATVCKGPNTLYQKWRYRDTAP